MLAYRDGPMAYVGHIGTDSNSAEMTRTVKLAWHSWAASNVDFLLTGFNPCRQAMEQPLPPPLTPPHGHDGSAPTFFGLLTQNFQCFVIIGYGQQPFSQPIQYRVAASTRVVGRPPLELKDIFANDHEIFGRDFPFTLTEWKNSTGGGAFHTRSTQLKNVDAALATYIDRSVPQNLLTLRNAFETWKREKPGEYQNPTRDKRMCITLLETYLRYHK
jgi:hypothetical protein